MERVTVLEWVRHEGGIWNLPAHEVDRLRAAFPDVRVLTPASRAEVDAQLPEADVVLGFAVRPDNLALARRLRWIHTTAAGVGGALFPALVDSDVTLTNARGLHARSMAEHTLGVMLAFARRLHVSRDAQRDRLWDQDGQWLGTPGFEELQGATLGIVGFGRIGQAIGSVGAALGMHVIGVRRRPSADPAPAHEQWGLDRLHELFARADWVVVSTPHTPETTRLVGAAELAVMKPTARLVNVGRGAVVDEPALIAALAEGRIAGAALDVFEDEPLAADSPLWGMREVIVTPHVSGVGPRYWQRALVQFGDNLRRYLAGEPLLNVVDKRAGY